MPFSHYRLIIITTVYFCPLTLTLKVCPHTYNTATHEILANKAFTVTDNLISQLFVVSFVHPTLLQLKSLCVDLREEPYIG